jgi:hypothetical protein
VPSSVRRDARAAAAIEAAAASTETLVIGVPCLRITTTALGSNTY